MLKRYLNVPFQDKNEAKKLGAKWDNAVKKWYIQENIDINLFKKWTFEGKQDINEDLEDKLDNAISADTYYLVNGKHPCWKCGVFTNVWGIKIQHKYATKDTTEFSEDDKEGNDPIFIGVTALSKDVIAEIHKYTKFFKKTYSYTAESSYYMNHCEHCNAKIGDWFLYSEPDGCFSPFPSYDDEEEPIKTYLINKPFIGVLE